MFSFLVHKAQAVALPHHPHEGSFHRDPRLVCKDLETTHWVDGEGLARGGVGWGGDDNVHERRGDRSFGWGACSAGVM